MPEYTLSFSWSVIPDHEKPIKKQLLATQEWFSDLLGTYDEMFYCFNTQTTLQVTYLEHQITSPPFTTVMCIQTPDLLETEEQDSILYQVRERLLSYTYCPFGPVLAKPDIHSEVISLDLEKASLPLMK